MPVYSYSCEKCGIEEEIVKPVSDYNTPEVCDDCGMTMVKRITPFLLNKGACGFQAHHNWAFGEKFTTKRQQDEYIRKYQGETGKQIVEVGTDTLQSVKKKFKQYDKD